MEENFFHLSYEKIWWKKIPEMINKHAWLLRSSEYEQYDLPVLGLQ